MSEREGQADKIDNGPYARFLPPDFSQRVPVEEGAEEVIQWLSNNLYPAVTEAIAGRKAFMPLGGPLTATVENLLDEQAHMVSKILWRYANYHYSIQLKKESHGSQPNQPLPAKCRTTIEQRRQRQLGVQTVLDSLGLQVERTILDALFKQSLAVPVEANRPAGHELVKKGSPPAS